MSEKKFTPTPAQNAAIKFRGADLIISAGAGSGKSTTLTNRIVARIISAKQDESREDIARKLIVTFTKDAANELRVKITTALSAAIKKNPTDSHLKEQLVRLGSADICTIDSFCLKLVRSNFERLGLDGSFRVSDETENEVLCGDAITEVLDRFYEEKSTDVDFLRVADAFSSFSGDEKLKSDLLSLYNTLITTKHGIKTLITCPEYNDDFLKTPYGEVLRRHMISALDYYISFFNTALEDFKADEVAVKALSNAFSSDRDFAVALKRTLEVGTYTEVKEMLDSRKAKKRGDIKEIKHINVDFYLDMRTSFSKLMTEHKKKHFSSTESTLRSSFDKNASVCRAIYNILSAFDEEYARKKRQAGVCDFNDISRYAMKLLYNEDGSKSSLATAIAEGYDEIYVDEYQDTNFLQDSIFKAISRNNRFLVGDIKQSIYRFRSAEPEIFSDYRTRFETVIHDEDGNVMNDRCAAPEGYSLFMAENFRCDKSVIDFSNAVSDFMFIKSRGIPYQAEDALRFKKPDCNYTPHDAEIYIIDKSKRAIDKEDGEPRPSEDSLEDVDKELELEEELLKREAEFVADKIYELIHGGKLANGKSIEAKDITILLHSFKKPVELYIDALKRRGIATEYRGDEHFFEKSEILLTLCILNAIDNPLRDVYLAGAMRSDLFGFSLADMINIRQQAKEEWSFYNAVKSYPLRDKLREKIDEFLSILDEFRAESRKKTSYDIISMVYAKTGLLSMASESERKSLLKLYDLARSYESGKYKGLYGFLRYVEGIKDSSGKEQIGSLDKNCVTLMSVHASKGLEFEVCFVCGCGSKMSAQELKEPMLYHRDLGVTAYVARDNGIAKFNTLLRRTSTLAINRSHVEEEMRLLYVAMTRARSKLIITAGIKDPQEFVTKNQRLAPFATEYSVLKPSCYMEWIVQACALDRSMPEPKIVLDEDIKHYTGNLQDKTAKRALTKEERAEVDKIKATLRARIDYKYPHEHLKKLPSKLSISRLYPEILDNEDNEEIKPKYGLDDIPPFARKGELKHTAAERGTATHVFLQFCELEALREENGIENELDRLTLDGYISEQLKALVNVDDIKKFVTEKESIYNDLLSARARNKLWRELRFNILIPIEELSEDEKLKDKKVLVQGVTDCIYENENGELVLVDYKTDLVTEDNYIEALTERHKTQLTYYKRAVEAIFGRNVSKALIYSVKLAKTVEI